MIRLHLSKQHIINIIFLALLTLFTASFLWSVYLQKENEDIILSPKTVICTETCEYKYRKID